MRPVLSMPGSPYYKIASKVTNWLSVLTESKCNSSTKDIAEKLGDLELEDGEVLVSFDMVSLYTNVPVKEAIKLAAEELYSGGVECPPVSKDAFLKLLELCSTNVIMSTHDGYYIQKDGLAMGSPPAPLLANTWLANMEDVMRGDAKLFGRYMDDVIRSISGEHVESKLTELNNIHPNLKFTVEYERDGQIPYLDMLLIREGKKVQSSWYCKPTDTGLVMNYHAMAPRRYKRGVVSGFVHRIHRACSTWQNFHLGLVKAKQVLEKNQYPSNFYEPIIRDTIEKIVLKTGKKDEDDQQDSYRIKLQYRGFTTEQFVKRLKESGAPIQVVLTVQKIKSALPSLKSTVPKMLKSNVVYQIKCPRCNACYVGKTSRHLTERIREHKSKSNGPVRKHLMKCGVDKDEVDENTSILATALENAFQLSILEALFIRELKPSMNTKDEFRDYELVLMMC